MMSDDGMRDMLHLVTHDNCHGNHNCRRTLIELEIYCHGLLLANLSFFPLYVEVSSRC